MVFEIGLSGWLRRSACGLWSQFQNPPKMHLQPNYRCQQLVFLSLPGFFPFCFRLIMPVTLIIISYVLLVLNFAPAQCHSFSSFHVYSMHSFLSTCSLYYYIFTIALRRSIGQLKMSVCCMIGWRLSMRKQKLSWWYCLSFPQHMINHPRWSSG